MAARAAQGLIVQRRHWGSPVDLSPALLPWPGDCAGGGLSRPPDESVHDRMSQTHPQGLTQDKVNRIGSFKVFRSDFGLASWTCSLSRPNQYKVRQVPGSRHQRPTVGAHGPAAGSANPTRTRMEDTHGGQKTTTFPIFSFPEEKRTPTFMTAQKG